MKKILILSSCVYSVYNQRFELLKELALNNEVYLMCNNENEDLKIKELKKIGVIYIPCNFERRGKNIFKEFNLLKEQWKKIKELNPNMIITYTLKQNLYGGVLSSLQNKNYINNITGMGSILQNNNLLSKVVKIIYKFALRKSKCVFFQNKYNLEYFKKNKLINENYKLVNGSGVNLERFNYGIKKLSCPKQLLFIGRIMQEKGIEEFLEAAKRVKEKYRSEIEFNILGQYEEEKYKSIIENLQSQGIIKYLGISNDVRNELKDVHCLVNPSWHEGMSNVLLESGAMKRFLIASDIPGCREIVVNNKTGFTFEKQNTDDLENKIEQFINLSEEEYEKYINSSYEHVKNNFDRKIVIEEYLKIINS